MGKQLVLLPRGKFKSRKTARAISVREFNHVIFMARRPILRENHLAVKRELRAAQLRWGIRLKTIAIMENHIHLAAKTPTRTALQNFHRHFAGTLAIRVVKGKLWSRRVWSRVVRAGRDLRQVSEYILRNPRKAGVLDARIDLHRLRDGILQP